ncbi:MAG: hypothetical protein ACC628_06655 [Pirellulaceae bacterium]
MRPSAANTVFLSSAFRHSARLGLLLCMCGLIGCGKTGEEPLGIPADLARYATLPHLQETHHPALQSELSRIICAKGTPALLQSSSAARPADATGSGKIDGQGPESPTGLADVFSPEAVAAITSRLERIFPTDNLEFSGLKLREAIELRQTYDGLRQRARQKLADPEFRFAVQHSYGLALDTTFVDTARVASRLEAIHAVESLHRDAPRGALEPLAIMLQIAEAMGRVKHVVPRIAAVQRRAEAFRLLEAIVTHARCEVSDQRRLATMLRGQLDRWPPDKDAWIGDRAQGMHTYELIRDGYLLSVLSHEEIRQYRREVGIAKLGKMVAANLDQDELFYLKAMRKVIEISDSPFEQRQKFFRTMANDLEQLRATPAYPLVADQILLLDIESGHRLQALDRARCEAWWLALSLAVNDPVDEDLVNPLTGIRYIIERRPSRIVVDAIDPDRNAPPVEVPIRL